VVAVEEPEFDAPAKKPVSGLNIPAGCAGQDDNGWRRLAAMLGNHSISNDEAYAQLFSHLTAVARQDATALSLAIWRVEAEREELGDVMSWRVRWLQDAFRGLFGDRWPQLDHEVRECCMTTIAQGFERRLLELSSAY
jgi:hypothetical protein